MFNLMSWIDQDDTSIAYGGNPWARWVAHLDFTVHGRSDCYIYIYVYINTQAHTLGKVDLN